MPNAMAEEAASLLPAWRMVTSADPDPAKTREELTRSYSFPSFGAAVGFMAAAVPHIDEADHHPRWENVYKTVTVWLSTHDAGNTVTRRDLQLAQFLDGLYRERTAG